MGFLGDLDIKPPPLSGGGDSDKKKPIGVPDDYVVEREVHYEDQRVDNYRLGHEPKSFMRDVKPLYYDGDEYVPANYPSTQIWQIQQALAKVGLLTGTFAKNVWDPATMGAYRELLALANAQGLSVDQALSELLATSGGKEGGRYTVDAQGNVVLASSETVPPLTTKTSDPAALRQVFRRATIELTGQGWSQDQINKMVAAYNNVEIERQTEAYNMQIAGEGGNIVDIPSPEEFIESQVLAKDPIGVQREEALGFTKEFMELASNTAWGVG